MDMEQFIKRMAARGWKTPKQQAGICRPASRRGLWHPLLFVALVCVAGTAAVQIPSPASAGSQPAASPATSGTPAAATAAPATTPGPPPDPLGRTTPYGCVLGFLRSAGNQNYARAAEYLDGKRSEEKSEELAAQLKALLDLGTSTDVDKLSRSPEGSPEKKLTVSRERVGVIKTPGGDLEVLLDRVERPKEAPIWLFSQETLRHVPEAYASVQHRDLASYFPAWASRIRFLSVPLWRWGAVAVSMVILLLAATLLTRAVVWLLTRIFQKRMTKRTESAVLALRGPTFGLMLGLLSRGVADYGITALGRLVWEKVGLFLLLVSGAWLLVRLIDIFTSFASHRLTQRMQIEQVTFVGLLGRLSKIVVVIILVILLLTLAGVNVSAVVAGLGIGGIALALAAQKTLADLFGGISVVMRGAARVGDFCTVAGRQGTVEEIGVSSLRLRTLDRSVISIPNSKVAEAELENFSLRDQFWLHPIFTLRFDTPHSVVRTVLEEIVKFLKARPDIDAGSARARLIQLTASGPQIEVFAYFQRPGSDYATFLEEQERIILEIMRVIEEAGTSMAAPIGVVRMPPQLPTSVPGRSALQSAVDRASADR